jgi:endoglucanase
MTPQYHPFWINSMRLSFLIMPLRRACVCCMVACAISVGAGQVPVEAPGDAHSQTNSPQRAKAAPQWMRIEGRTLVADGKPVQLRGIGLGNWMLVEHFMIGLPQVDYVMRQTFTDVLGPERAAAFWDAYMDNYFTEKDVARIRELGFNHVRLPFSYRQLESDAQPGQWREEGFRRLDRMIGWCRRQGLWVLLDLHSAPGCQASDWNAESAHGEVFLWDNADDQKRVAALWHEIARRYRNEPTVMAYEVLNEPDTTFPRQVASLNAFHLRCIRAIREVDKRHIIVVDGDKHATDLRVLDAATFEDPQVMAAFHFYYQFTPPLRNITSFPSVHDGLTIDADFVIHHTGLTERSDRGRIARPEYLDEFGFQYWTPAVDSQRKIIETIIGWCERENVNWCLWHWKDVRGMGLWHMREGTPWMKLLERLGTSRLQTQSRAAIKAYLDQVNSFLPLGPKDRAWLEQETRRELQMQMLRKLVEQMKGLTTEELAALGRSFNSDNFEIDKPMAAALERLMKGDAASLTVDELPAQSSQTNQNSEPAVQSRADPAGLNTVPPGYAGKPYGGEVRQIPGIIQAEQYDVVPGGANDVTFHYNGPARGTNLRVTGDSIGLASFGNGHVNIKGEPEKPDQVYVGWTETGQWMKYSVHVKERGTYRLGGHFAAGGKDAMLSVTFTPEIKTGPIAIPTTAGYQPGVEVYHVWETLNNLADIDLPAGDFVMTVKIENAGGMNIDYLSFARRP